MMKNLRAGKRVFTVIVVIALLASVTAATMHAFALQPVTLTLIGGTGTITKNQDDILAMPSISGDGGTRTSSGKISNVGTYAGVSVLYVCNLVGGITSDSIISLIDTTGTYIVNFTYQQVNDGQGFNTYNPTTGDAQAATQPLTLILAYSVNGSELASSSGPLRAVIVGSEGLLTEGTFWNKQIEKIQIYPAVPEYPIGAIFALTACFLTLVAYVAFKKGAGIAQLNTRRQELKRGN